MHATHSNALDFFQGIHIRFGYELNFNPTKKN